MAITTMDGAVAGMGPPQPFLKIGAATVAGRYYSPFYVTGNPGAAATPAPGIAGAALTTYAGQLPFGNPVTGNSYLARFSAVSSATGRLILCDRLWHNSGIATNSTAAQTVNSVTWPARDALGNTNGEDVLVGVEVTAATTNNSNCTMSYTNSAGTAARTSVAVQVASGGSVGNFFPLSLAAGDTGVRSIQTVTFATQLGGGSVSLVAYRILAEIDVFTANIGAVQDMFGCGFGRLWDNTVPFLLFLPATTTAPTIAGSYTVSQG